MKEKITEFLKRQKKEQITVFVLIAALILVIFLPTGKSKEKTAEEIPEKVQEQEHETAGEMEEALERALSCVEGVGKVQVAITLESTGKRIVEKDIPDSSREQKSQGDGDSSESREETREETTVYQRDGDGTEVPYVIAEEFPAVRGVLVIAEGGDNPILVQEIQEAVMALFQVDAHKIKVMKMK